MANGTIAFDTLQTSGQIDGTARSIDTDYLLNGSAKVWHTGSSDGTSLEDSFNVTTLTDTGTGRQTLTLSNNMTNALYAVRSAIHEGQSRLTFCDNRATSSYESAVYAADNSAYSDGNQNSVVHGELA